MIPLSPHSRLGKNARSYSFLAESVAELGAGTFNIVVGAPQDAERWIRAFMRNVDAAAYLNGITLLPPMSRSTSCGLHGNDVCTGCTGACAMPESYARFSLASRRYRDTTVMLYHALPRAESLGAALALMFATKGFIVVLDDLYAYRPNDPFAMLAQSDSPPAWFRWHRGNGPFELEAHAFETVADIIGLPDEPYVPHAMGIRQEFEASQPPAIVFAHGDIPCAKAPKSPWEPLLNAGQLVMKSVYD